MAMTMNMSVTDIPRTLSPITELTTPASFRTVPLPDNATTTHSHFYVFGNDVDNLNTQADILGDVDGNDLTHGSGGGDSEHVDEDTASGHSVETVVAHQEPISLFLQHPPQSPTSLQQPIQIYPDDFSASNPPHHSPPITIPRSFSQLSLSPTSLPRSLPAIVSPPMSAPRSLPRIPSPSASLPRDIKQYTSPSISAPQSLPDDALLPAASAPAEKPTDPVSPVNSPLDISLSATSFSIPIPIPTSTAGQRREFAPYDGRRLSDTSLRPGQWVKSQSPSPQSTSPLIRSPLSTPPSHDLKPFTSTTELWAAHSGMAGVGAGGRSRPTSVKGRSRPNSFYGTKPEDVLQPGSEAMITPKLLEAATMIDPKQLEEAIAAQQEAQGLPTPAFLPSQIRPALIAQHSHPTLHNIPIFPNSPLEPTTPVSPLRSRPPSTRSRPTSLLVGGSRPPSSQGKGDGSRPITLQGTPFMQRVNSAVDVSSPAWDSTLAASLRRGHSSVDVTFPNYRSRLSSRLPSPAVTRNSSIADLPTEVQTNATVPPVCSQHPEWEAELEQSKSIIDTPLSITSHDIPSDTVSPTRRHSRRMSSLFSALFTSEGNVTAPRRLTKTQSQKSRSPPPARATSSADTPDEQLLHTSAVYNAIRRSDTFGITDDGSEMSSPVRISPGIRGGENLQLSRTNSGSVVDNTVPRVLYVENGDDPKVQDDAQETMGTSTTGHGNGQGTLNTFSLVDYGPLAMPIQSNISQSKPLYSDVSINPQVGSQIDVGQVMSPSYLGIHFSLDSSKVSDPLADGSHPPSILSRSSSTGSRPLPIPPRLAKHSDEGDDMNLRARPVSVKQSFPGSSINPISAADGLSPDLPLLVASHLLSTHASALLRHSETMHEVSQTMRLMATESLEWGSKLMGMASNIRSGNADHNIQGTHQSARSDLDGIPHSLPHPLSQPTVDNFTSIPPRPSALRHTSRSNSLRLSNNSPQDLSAKQSMPAVISKDNLPRASLHLGPEPDDIVPASSIIASNFLREAERLGREGWASLRAAEDVWTQAMAELRGMVEHPHGSLVAPTQYSSHLIEASDATVRPRQGRTQARFTGPTNTFEGWSFPLATSTMVTNGTRLNSSESATTSDDHQLSSAPSTPSAEVHKTALRLHIGDGYTPSELQLNYHDEHLAVDITETRSDLHASESDFKAPSHTGPSNSISKKLSKRRSSIPIPLAAEPEFRAPREKKRWFGLR